jgi:hypothetical protein
MGIVPKSVVVCFCFMLLSTPVLSWTVSEDTDPFTDEPELYISNGDITFRCRGASFDVVIPFGEYLSSDFVKGIYRFDKNVSVEVEFGISTTGTSVFVQDTNNFTYQALRSEKLLIKVYDYQGTGHTKSIELDGLPSETILRAASLCKKTILSEVEDAKRKSAADLEYITRLVEADLIRGMQLATAACWNLGALSSAALSTIVVVEMELTLDGKPVPNSIKMLGYSGENERSAADAFEAAVDAITRCGAQGFELPKDQYATWRRMELTFNPERMRVR